MCIEEKLRRSLHECGKRYSQDMKVFSPSKIIHESNLVTKYLHSVEKVFDGKVVYWTEFSLGRKQRMDAVIYAEPDIIILVEAKRIRQGKTKGVANYQSAIQQIKSDTTRMSMEKHVNTVNTVSHPINKIFRVMLGQIWVDSVTQIALEKWMEKEIFPSWKDSILVDKTDWLSGDENNNLRLLIAISSV